MSFDNITLRYSRTIVRQVLKSCAILFFFSGWVFGQSEVPVGAVVPLLESQLYWKDWPERPTTEKLLRLEVVRALLSSFKEDTGQTIVIRYPGGDKGNDWALEFKEWLIAFGLPSHYISLQPGSGGIDRLFILLEVTSEGVGTKE